MNNRKRYFIYYKNNIIRLKHEDYRSIRNEIKQIRGLLTKESFEKQSFPGVKICSNDSNSNSSTSISLTISESNTDVCAIDKR